jgi:hypothetical protein
MQMFWDGFYQLATVIGAWVLWTIIGAAALAITAGIMVCGTNILKLIWVERLRPLIGR